MRTMDIKEQSPLRADHWLPQASGARDSHQGWDRHCHDGLHRAGDGSGSGGYSRRWDKAKRLGMVHTSSTMDREGWVPEENLQMLNK